MVNRVMQVSVKIFPTGLNPGFAQAPVTAVRETHPGVLQDIDATYCSARPPAPENLTDKAPLNQRQPVPEVTGDSNLHEPSVKGRKPLS